MNNVGRGGRGLVAGESGAVPWYVSGRQNLARQAIQ